MTSGRFLRWPIAASFVGHAAVLGGMLAYESMRPEPPPKPVEIVMTAVPTSMDALSMKAEETEPVQPEAAQTARPVETATPVPVEAARPVPVETVKPVDTAATPPPPPPDEVETAKAEEIPVEKPVEQVAEVDPTETRPVEDRVEAVAQDVVPPPPKPRRPVPPRREPTPVAARPSPAPTPNPQPAEPAPAPIADAAPASPSPPAQTAMLSAPAPRPARPSGPSQSYLAALRAQLERHKTYPPVAQRRRMEGTTTVRFTIARSGTVLNYRIVGSSGHSLLDREVEELLQRASPLPALPSDVDGEQLEIVVPISFYLR